MASAVGTRCSPPIPLRFGSTKRSVSFHMGLVKSIMASSRPNTGLFSRCPGPQHFHTQSSSPGDSRSTSRTAKSCMYRSGKRFRAFRIVSDT